MMRTKSKQFFSALLSLTIVSATVVSASPEIDGSIRKGIDFLLKDQNENGSWGSPRQTKGLNIYAPVPGAHHAFRAAVTAMCVTALIESDLVGKEGAELDALVAGEAFLLEELPKVRRASADAMYNVWTHAYGLQALVRMHRRANGDMERQERTRMVMETQIDRLERYESVDGGWGYYDFRAGTARPSSSSIGFVGATVLVAFHEAKEIEGIEIPQPLVDRAIAAINRQRKPDNSYLYGEYMRVRPMYSINRPGGSLGRSQACNYALSLWGDETITTGVIDEWLTRLWERNGWLDIGRKRPVPHEAWFAIAGYFYYYGHYYAGMSLELLPEESRSEHADSLAGILLPLQEKDGSWWDYPFYSYHQPYGTAFAIQTLSRCR